MRRSSLVRLVVLALIWGSASSGIKLALRSFLAGQIVVVRNWPWALVLYAF